MKKLIITLGLLVTLQVKAALQFTVTTNVMIATCYDSFDEGQAGNGHFVYDIASIQLNDPLHMYRFRTASQAGQNNYGFVTNNLPSVILPLFGAMNGTNECWLWLGVSGNGGFASTANAGWYTTNITLALSFPMTNWSYHLYYTNDWPYTTNNLHATVFGDSVYLGDNATRLPIEYTYDFIASNAAASKGFPYIQSEVHTSYETNIYQTNVGVAQLQYYDHNVAIPDWTHPSRENFQYIRHQGDYKQMGGETNIFSAILDFTSATVASSATNRIVVSGITKTANSYSCTVKALGIGGPIQIGDAQHTNNNLKAFAILPSITNWMKELVIFSNAPAGTFVWAMDGIPTMTNSSVNGFLTNNYFHNYKGPWFDQKMLILNDYLAVRDVNTTNSADYVGSTYQRNFSANAGVTWRTSNGTADYVSKMLTYEKTMETLDVKTFNDAQQTTHTLTVTLVTQMNVGNLNIGTLTVYP